MITQNPITGRSRNKLAGVYARTLWGKNVLQSCPTPSHTPPSPALQASRNAFGRIMRMANMIPPQLMNSIFYSAPVGRSRRHTLASQLFTGVSRNGSEITFNLDNITAIGSNTVSCNAGVLVTITDSTLQLYIPDLSATTSAITNEVPLLLAVSYEREVCYPMIDLTSIEEEYLVVQNIPSTIFNVPLMIYPLWTVNVGTLRTPVYAYGSYSNI